MIPQHEHLLHYIWSNGLFNTNNLITTDLQPIKIEKFGTKNYDAGPDFFNAKIQIGDTLWVGNIEIHIHSSDWNKHKHDTNTLYDSVILHVVAQHDSIIKRSNGTIVPEIIIPVDKAIIDTFNELQNKKQTYACFQSPLLVDSILVKMWLQRMFVERIEYKIETVNITLEKLAHNWDSAFYSLLFRAMGSNVNAQAFEVLSKHIPLSILLKHKNSLFQIEALLFGQAGFLSEITTIDNNSNDETDMNYYLSLQQEYQFLKKKYSLEPMEIHQWKLMRMRPVNFPTIRIAQLAKLLEHFEGLFSRCLELSNFEEYYTLFDCDVSVFWLTHFRFNQESNFKNKKIGRATINTILINAVIPSMYQFGKATAQERYCEKAIELSEFLTFETNSITKPWLAIFEHDKPSAMHSQAIIHLSKNYCEKRRCLQCAIGDKIMRTRLKNITL